MSRDRKHARPPSWLAAIKAATVAFTGQASLIEDEWVPATETSFRGAGYRLTAEINPVRALFGSLPDTTVNLQGETSRAPDTRLTLDASLFPPDNLRQVSYWDYARSGIVQPVLVVMAEPPLVRLLTGTDDSLPDAVTIIHHWTKLSEAEQKTTVLTDLGKPGHSPVAYTAGFELLMSITSGPVESVDMFLNLSGRPGAATQGALEILYLVGTSLPGQEIKALAWRLLEGWSQESDPAALSSYLLWFDAHRMRTWVGDQDMKEAVLAQAERASALSFTGSNAEAWEQQVRYYASSLLPGA